MYKLFCIALLIVIIGGCAVNQEPITEEEHYDEDGYMGLTNANPSLVATPNSHTYASDIELIKRALKDVSGIQKSTIFVDGNTAFIQIHVDKGLLEEEVRIIRDNAQRQVSLMIPRYEIHVTVDQ
jgi:hypothetical protein